MEIIIKINLKGVTARILQRKSDPLEPHQDGESLITTKTKKSSDPTYTATSALPTHTYALKQRCSAAQTPFAEKVKEGLTRPCWVQVRSIWVGLHSLFPASTVQRHWLPQPRATRIQTTNSVLDKTFVKCRSANNKSSGKQRQSLCSWEDTKKPRQRHQPQILCQQLDPVQHKIWLIFSSKVQLQKTN